MHRIPLELVAVVACPHVGLLASKLGGKASTNLGAPQLKALEAENAKLKKMLAEQMLDVATLKEMLGKNF
jgi:hypothetical protein